MPRLLSEAKELEGSIQTRIFFDEKSDNWVIRIYDQIGLVQEFYSKTEPIMMVYLQDKFSENPIVRMYPSDEISKYRKLFEKYNGIYNGETV